MHVEVGMVGGKPVSDLFYPATYFSDFIHHLVTKLLLSHKNVLPLSQKLFPSTLFLRLLLFSTYISISKTSPFCLLPFIYPLSLSHYLYHCLYPLSTPLSLSHCLYPIVSTSFYLPIVSKTHSTPLFQMYQAILFLRFLLPL